MKIILFSLLVSLTNISVASEVHPCQGDAVQKAGQLIRLHFGEDDRITIDDNIKLVHPIINPANKKQSFDVLEVWGYIYKGTYRMRFIYAQMEDCVLMGQEILEYASF